MRLPFHRNRAAATGHDGAAGTRVCALDDLAVGEVRRVHEHPAIAVVRHADHLHAFEDRCPHAGALLSRGSLDGDVLTCPAHKASFRIDSGASQGPLDCRDLRTYDVWVAEDGDVYVAPTPRPHRSARKTPCPEA